MKRLLTSLATAVLLPATLLAGQWTGISSSVPDDIKVHLVTSSDHETVLELQLPGFEKIPAITPQGAMWKIAAPGAAALLRAGAPDVPKAVASVIIPDYARMEVEIVASSFVDYPGIEIAPSKGSLLRTQDPAQVPYEFGEAYDQDAFFPGKLAELRKPFVVRDFRGQTAWIYPFQYNPVSKVLRVYTSMRLRIYEVDGVGENVLVRSKPLTAIDPEYKQVYTSLFRNGGNAVSYIPLSEEGNMLIIAPAAYASAMQPFMEWKARRGLTCELVDVAVIGNTDTDIKNYIAAYYLSHDLKYILLVGDDADVATPYLSGGASDPSYGYMVGSDSYAEVMVGRFSAASIADVQTLVQRSIEYEANPTVGGTWYRKGVGIASDQGPGDDGEMDWEHIRNIRTGMVNYGYTDVDELYDGTQGNFDNNGDPNASELIAVINDGRSVINYAGHGSQNACATTGFSSSDVPLLTNAGMLPFWWSVGCVHGEFDGGTCIAEVLTRAQSGGQPTGMVATFMSSINQYWDEPMDAQDVFDSLLTESYVNNVKRTYGGISVNGCMKMNDTYGSSGDDMTDTWHIFGDPSLVVRNNVPFAITATHLAVIPVGTTQLAVGCNTNGACVTLTNGLQILGKGSVTSNAVTLTFPALITPDTLILTATAFNGIPYSTQIVVIPASGPYVVYTASTVNDPSGNGNGLPDYGESIDLDVTLSNMGLSMASQVTAVLSTTDLYVTIQDSTAAYGTLMAGSTQPLAGAFSYTLASNVPDQHVVTFNLVVTDNALNTWNNGLMQTVNAPSLEIVSVIVNDVSGNNNGFLDPGETADVTFTTANSGHSASPPAVGTLSSLSPYVTINSGTSSMGSIAAGNNFGSVLNVSLASNITLGSPFDLTYNVAASAYSVSQVFTLSAGEILEDFETNNFSKFNWTSAGNVPWFTTAVAPYQGLYCAESGNIGGNASSELLLQVNVLMSDSVSFYQKVSSEPGYDFLRFYLDGIQLAQWSGNGAWTYQSYYVPSGTHMLRWSYEKDAFASSGADAAWLDNIQLPPMFIPTGIQETSLAPIAFVYPNPVSDRAALVFPAGTSGKANILLYDMKGSLVTAIAEERMLNGGETLYFSTQSLARGVYTLRVQVGDTLQAIRLVK